jgi:3-oxoadipate enol-lactonase
MGYARLNGINTYYEVSGSGPRLLFLNGSGATLAEASFLVEPIAERFEVAAMDPRGLGRTGPAPNPYSVSDLATDASALVDHLGWEHFRLMGLSFGGMVAQELAVTNLQRLDGLALLCTSAGGTGGSSFPLETLTNMDPAERDLLYPRLLDTRFTPDWLADHESDRALIDLVLARLSAQQPDHVRKGAEMQLRARSEHDVYDRLPEVRCPSLVAAGRFDGISPPDNSVAIAEQMPQAELRLFDGGHLFAIQDPTAVPEILQFLATTSRIS